MNKLFTTSQVAEILGIKKLNTIYRWIKDGRLKATKLGGNGKSKRPWRIKQGDLEAFINHDYKEESIEPENAEQKI